MGVWFSIGLSRELELLPVVDPGFPIRETKNLANFSRKLHKNEKNWAERTGACAPQIRHSLCRKVKVITDEVHV